MRTCTPGIVSKISSGKAGRVGLLARVYRRAALLSGRSVMVLALGCFVVSASSGCSSFHAAPLAVGTVGGAAAGAGTGAIVGTLIANGDVAASALLGGAIGIPVGLAIGAIYDYNSEPSVQERNRAEIEANQEEIFARQRELDSLREDLRDETPGENPADSNREYHYNGPTLGNYYR